MVLGESPLEPYPLTENDQGSSKRMLFVVVYLQLKAKGKGFFSFFTKRNRAKSSKKKTLKGFL
jgi:hypothetical protein